MKKLISLVLLFCLLLAAVGAWVVFGSGTTFLQKQKVLLIYPGNTNEKALTLLLQKEEIVNNLWAFKLIASQLGVWQKIMPGRYEILRGESLFTLAKKLKNNQQSPVKLVINKLRLPADLAKIVAQHFMADSLSTIQFLTNPDSIAQFNVDTNTLMTMVIPNTYNVYWTTPVNEILTRLNKEKNTFWDKNERLQKAAAMSLTPVQVYTIASIVEEETNKNDEKGNVASVYINRYNKGMPLGADPTIKFALKDFKMKRIYFKDLMVQSPYNTYRNKGLPPGPICTPSVKTIDAVLSAPATDYLFFVAKSDFSGYHSFSENFAEHKRKAAEYQKALNEMIIRKQKANQPL